MSLTLSLHNVDHTPKPIRLELTKDSYSSNPLKLLYEFHKLLAALYTEIRMFKNSRANSLFLHIALPTLTASQRECIEKPILFTEVLNAIKSFKHNILVLIVSQPPIIKCLLTFYHL